MKAKIWLYPGDTAWHFASVGEKHAAVIKKAHGAHARGFGSLPVRATVGKTSWDTSIFPDKKSGTYLLPLKLAIRRKEGIADGDIILLTLEVRV
ncbi:MAG: DUF1905 domain-containing protein [Patescibacteria group bacterium]